MDKQAFDIFSYRFVDKVDPHTVFLETSFTQQCNVTPNNKSSPTSVFEQLPKLLDLFQTSNGKCRTTTGSHHSIQQSNKASCYIEKNTYLLNILSIMNSSVTLLHQNDQHNALLRFQTQLAEDLNNSNQWFKKLGFTRKKAISLDQMVSNLTNCATDDSLTYSEFAYLSHYTKHRLTVLNIKSNDIWSSLRYDYEPSETSNQNIIIINMVKLSLQVQSEKEVDHYVQSLVQEANITQDSIKNLKVEQLKSLCMLFNIVCKGLKKANLIDLLQNKWKNIDTS